MNSNRILHALFWLNWVAYFAFQLLFFYCLRFLLLTLFFIQKKVFKFIINFLKGITHGITRNYPKTNER